jgi:hypothetical protein
MKLLVPLTIPMTRLTADACEHAGFVQEWRSRACRNLEQFIAVRRDERLVRRDDGDAAAQRIADDRSCWFELPEDLHHHVGAS